MANVTLYGTQTLIPAAPTTYNCVVSAGTSLEQTNEVRLLVDTTTDAATINLPSISSFGGSNKIVLYIVDIAANASSNNIVVNCGAGNFISCSANSASTVTIATDSGILKLELASDTVWSTVYF